MEESLAIIALHHRAEIEFRKITVLVNAIMVGAGGGADELNKSLDALKGALLPHYAEQIESRATRAKALLIREAAKGPLTIKVVGAEKGRRRNVPRGTRGT